MRATWIVDTNEVWVIINVNGRLDLTGYLFAINMRRRNAFGCKYINLKTHEELIVYLSLEVFF